MYAEILHEQISYPLDLDGRPVQSIYKVTALGGKRLLGQIDARAAGDIQQPAQAFLQHDKGSADGLVVAPSPDEIATYLGKSSSNPDRSASTDNNSSDCA